MSLGLSHSLSRYKLKFSPDKVGLTRPFTSSVKAMYLSCANPSTLGLLAGCTAQGSISTIAQPMDRVQSRPTFIQVPSQISHQVTCLEAPFALCAGRHDDSAGDCAA